MFDNLPDQIKSLNQKAVKAYQKGQFEEGIQFAKQACELGKYAFGLNHPSYATSLNNLAEFYSARGRFADAEPLYQQAIEICKVQLGENHPDYATSLNGLAGLYYATGRFADAEPLYQQATQICKEQLGENHPHYATSLNNLAVLYYARGRFAEAEPLYVQATQIRKVQLGENHPSYATSLNNLAEFYSARGRFADAEPLFQQATQIRKVQLGENHPSYATSLNNLAGLYNVMGRFADAEPLFQQATQIRKVQLGENHPDYAASLNNLAGLYYAMGRFADAEPLYQQATEIRKVQLGENHPDYAASLNNLAVLYYATGRFAKAEPLYQQATQILKVQLGLNHPSYATSLNNLAEFYSARGRFADAEPLYQQATQIRKVQLGENHPDYAASLNNFALLHYAMGRFAEAEPLYQQATQIWKVQLGENHPDYAGSLNNLAGLMAATDRPQEAFQLMQEATQIKNQIIGEIISISSDRQRLEYMQQNQGDLYQFLSLIAQYLPQDLAAKRAALDLVLRRKGLATEAGILLRTLIYSGRYPHLKPEFEKLAQLTHQKAYFTWQVPTQQPERLPAYRQQLAQLTREKEELERSLSRQIPEMNLRSQLDNASRGAIAEILPEGSTLLEFVRFDPFNFKAVKANGDPQWFPPRYLAFVLSGGDAEAVEMVDLGEAEEIDRLCRKFRKSVSGEDKQKKSDRGPDLSETDDETDVPILPSIFTSSEGQELYGKLIQPLKPYLQPQQTVYLAPDGELATLPFGILSVEGSAYLMNEYALRYLSVGRDLLRLNFPIPVEHTPALVIANPDYNLRLEIGETQEHPIANPSKPPKQPQPIAKEMILAVAIAIAVVTFFVLLAVFPTVGILVLVLGMIWLAVAVQKWSYSDRLQEFEEQAREYDRQVTQSQDSPEPSTREGGFRLCSREFHSPQPPDVRSLSEELQRGQGETFKPLPGTKIEGERVAQLLGVRVHTEAQAVKSLLSQSHSPKIVHIATHGYFLEVSQTPAPVSTIGPSRLHSANFQDPMTRSGLAFAGANTALQEGVLPGEAEEGLLTSQNALMLDLTGTQLVVLSACDTALGDLAIGEGVIGLRRSLILAGAETLVMSLWKIPDVPTAILMERLYGNLLDKAMPRTIALEEAQDYLKHLTIAQMRDRWLTQEAIAQVENYNYSSAVYLQELSQKPDNFMPFFAPSFWAAFVSIGNPYPMEGTGNGEWGMGNRK